MPYAFKRTGYVAALVCSVVIGIVATHTTLLVVIFSNPVHFIFIKKYRRFESQATTTRSLLFNITRINLFFVMYLFLKIFHETKPLRLLYHPRNYRAKKKKKFGLFMRACVSSVHRVFKAVASLKRDHDFERKGSRDKP